MSIPSNITESLIDDLLERVSNISIISDSSDSDNESTINMELSKLHLEAVPVYDGEPATLSMFISGGEYLMQFSDRTNRDNPINSYLLRVILSKLTGRAAVLIGNREDANSWPRIKELLLQFFGDQRDENCLLRDLLNLKPERNETPYQFGIRCQDVRSLLLSRIKLYEQDANTRKIKTTLYDQRALDVYLSGLQGNLGLAVRMQKPTTLEKAMALVIEEENFHYARNTNPSSNNNYNNPRNNNQTHNYNNQKNYLPNKRMAPAWQPNYQNFSHPVNWQHPIVRNFSRPYNQNFQPRPFLPRSESVRRQPQNQNFNQRNVFAPGQGPRNTYKPTPMDTSSGNTKRTQQPSYQYPKRQNFVSQELFHQETKPWEFRDRFNEPSTSTSQEPNKDFCTEDQECNQT